MGGRVPHFDFSLHVRNNTQESLRRQGGSNAPRCPSPTQDGDLQMSSGGNVPSVDALVPHRLAEGRVGWFPTNQIHLTEGVAPTGPVGWFGYPVFSPGAGDPELPVQHPPDVLLGGFSGGAGRHLGLLGKEGGLGLRRPRTPGYTQDIQRRFVVLAQGAKSICFSHVPSPSLAMPEGKDEVLCNQLAWNEIGSLKFNNAQ